MKNIIPVLILSIFLTACSSDGTLKIINKTSHEIYISIEGKEHTMTGSVEPEDDPVTYSVKLDAGNDFLQNPEKSYIVYLEGETFAIYDYDNYVVVPCTEVTIKRSKTVTVYCNPNYACLRITNNSVQIINSVWYQKSIEQNNILVPDSQIYPDQSIYHRLDHAEKNPQSSEEFFYYSFMVVLQDSTVLEYGGEGNYLYKDDLFLIEVE